MGVGGGEGSACAGRGSSARLLPALQVEVREPPPSVVSAPLAAAARRAEPLLPSPLNWAPKTGRSRRRKSLSRSALGFPGPERSQSAPVIAILPGNENERAGSGFHSRPGRPEEGRRRALRERSGGDSWLASQEASAPLAASR